MSSLKLVLGKMLNDSVSSQTQDILSQSRTKFSISWSRSQRYISGLISISA